MASPIKDTYEFFLVALPGLEDLVRAEVQEWFPEFEPKPEHGGVTVMAPLSEGLAMNLALKTPTRILMRISTFRCRDFPKLYNKVLSLPWKEWVDPSCELEVHASTRLSRLKIKSRIADACKDAWGDYQKKLGVVPKRDKVVNLYVRFADDECTLSLDTSGERLHKRGTRVLIGDAPLRETIAAALIQLVGRNYPTSQADGKADADIELIDPMMGSGTFLIEAASRDELVEARSFAFETFARQPNKIPKLKVQRPKFSKLVGFESDAKTMVAAKTNLKAIPKSYKVDVQAKDFFKAAPMPESTTPRWLFCNPPYNERIKVKQPLAELYTQLFAACEQIARPERACFILAAKAVKGRFSLPVGWKVLEKRPFLNGGIPVIAFVFGRTPGSR